MRKPIASVIRRALVSLIQLGNVELGSLDEIDLMNENILEGIDALSGGDQQSARAIGRILQRLD